MKLSTKVAYNTIIQILSKFLSTGIGLLVMIIVIRYLNLTEFGEYTTIVTFLSFFGIAADMGLTLVTVQMISKEGSDEEEAIGNLLSLRIISAIIILGVAPLLALFFPYSREMKYCISIGTLSFLFIALNQVFVGLFQKRLRMDKVSIAEIISRVFLLLGMLLVLKTDWGIAGVIWVTIVSSAVNFALHIYFGARLIKIRLRFDPKYWKKILQTSWPMAITITLNLIYLKTDTLLLSILKRPSEIGIIAEVGIYGAAYKVIEVLVTIPFMFAGIILPIITNLWSKNDLPEFKRVLQKSFEVMVILAIPLAIGTQFVARQIMVIIAGEAYLDSGPILQILIIASALIFIGNVFSHAIIAIEQVKKLIPIYLFTAASSFLIYLIVIPRFSYFGAAWGTIYSETVIMFAFIYINYKYTNFLPNLSIVFKSLLASLIMSASVLLLQHFNFESIFIIIPVSIIVYFVSIILLKGVAKEELMQIIKRK